MLRVLTAAVLIPLVLALVFWNNLPALTVAVGLVSMLTAWELMEIAAKSGAPGTPRIAVLFAIGVLFLSVYFRPDYTSATMTGLMFILLALCSFQLPMPEILPATAASVFTLLYAGWSLSTLLLISSQGNGPSLLVLLFIAVWSGDVAALYVGRAFGKHKLTRLSPGKTWEGTFASAFAALLCVAFLFAIAAALNRRGLMFLNYTGPLWRTLLLALLLNAAAQLGDLLESGLKRGAGLKDSGTLLPGHGGVLDRVDALLLAAPVLWYALLAQQAL